MIILICWKHARATKANALLRRAKFANSLDLLEQVEPARVRGAAGAGRKSECVINNEYSDVKKTRFRSIHNRRRGYDDSEVCYAIHVFRCKEADIDSHSGL